MNAEIFVHGVPNGESFWGKDEDRNYFGNFYSQSSEDEVQFLIQTRLSHGKPYCYYNYLVYKNVRGSDNRSGSYFGLSIRLDGYCKDIMGMYKIMDMVFSAAVLGKVISHNNGNYKYLISNFNESPNLMQNIEEFAIQLIITTFTEDSFVNLSGFATTGSGQVSANIYEIDETEIQNTVRQYGKIALSPYYQTMREKNLIQQQEFLLQSTRQQMEEHYGAIILSKDKDLKTLKSSMSSTQDEQSRLREEIKRQDTHLQQLQKELERAKADSHIIESNRKALSLLNEIRKPIIDLANVLKQGESGSMHNPTSPKNKGIKLGFRDILRFFNSGLLLVVLAVLLLKPFNVQNQASATEIKELQDTIATQRIIINNLESIKTDRDSVGEKMQRTSDSDEQSNSEGETNAKDPTLTKKEKD